MATEIRFRGGSAAEHASFIGAAKEITVDTTNWRLRLHDGVTPGGRIIGSGGEGSTCTPQGRLSLISGVAIAASDVAGSPTLYYVPSTGNEVPVYDGSAFTGQSIGSGLALSLDADSGHSGYHQSGRNFDVFVIEDAGTVRLGTGPAWNAGGGGAGSDTARGTGTGSTELELFDGFWVNKNAVSIRFGAGGGNAVSVPARQATYVGSFRATANGQTDDTQAKRLVYNAYNQAPRMLSRKEPADTWNYVVAAWRQQNANAANRFDVLAGLGGSLIELAVTGRANASAAASASVGVGFDKTNDSDAQFSRAQTATSTAWAYPEASYTGNVPLGLHYYAVLERGEAVATMTWVSGADRSVTNIGTVWL